MNRDKRHLNRTLSIEKELPKKRIHKEIFDHLVIAIDGESEKCFVDPQISPEKKKRLLQKKVLIKRGSSIKQHNPARSQGLKESNQATTDDKENQYWKANGQPGAYKIKKSSEKSTV